MTISLQMAIADFSFEMFNEDRQPVAAGVGRDFGVVAPGRAVGELNVLSFVCICWSDEVCSFRIDDFFHAGGAPASAHASHSYGWNLI